MKKLLIILLLAVSYSSFSQNTVEMFKITYYSNRSAETNWDWQQIKIVQGFPIVKLYRNHKSNILENLMKVVISSDGKTYFSYDLPYVGKVNNEGGLEFIGVDDHGNKGKIELVMRETSFGLNYFDLYIRHDALEMCYKFEGRPFYSTRD